MKVQYPGIEAALSSEFLAAAGGAQFARLLAPAGNVGDFITEARERMLAECDYVQELAWQQRFRKLFARHRVLRVPEVFPAYSSRRVLTSSWEEGIRLEAWLKARPSQEERNRIGEALYEFYVGSLLRHGIFNADPHPGNYLFRSDGKLVILDYGCVRQFSAAPDAVPSAETVSKMMEYNKALQKAGVLLALDGLFPPSTGARISYVGGKPTVTDGPFAETKEVIDGAAVSGEETLALAADGNAEVLVFGLA